MYKMKGTKYACETKLKLQEWLNHGVNVAHSFLCTCNFFATLRVIHWESKLTGYGKIQVHKIFQMLHKITATRE